MPFSFYTDRPWKVTSAEPGSKCPQGTRVEFRGAPEEVKIYSDGKIVYEVGKYIDSVNMIVSQGNYEIHALPLILPWATIQFVPDRSARSTDGSWTADDNIPGPGDS